MDIIETVVAGLIVAAVGGLTGFFIKRMMGGSEAYLPTISKTRKEAYRFLEGKWHEYHFTFEPKSAVHRWLAHAEIDFSIGRSLIIQGRGHFPTEHRRVLHYLYRGQVYSGNLYYTAVCIDDPNDAYCALYKNVNDDLIAGVITGLDYAKEPFASPILLSKVRLSDEDAANALENAPIKFFAGVTVPAQNDGRKL